MGKGKKRSAHEEHHDQEQDGDGISLDLSRLSEPLRRFDMDKAAMAALILVALALVVWIRMLPAALPVTDDWAHENIRQNVRMQFAQQIDSQFPSLPQANKDALIDERTDQFIAENEAAFEGAKQELSLQLKDRMRYVGDDGENHTYLGDLDSYFWLRYTRNWLETGTACDEITADGECRETYQLAPVGQPMSENPSTHVFAIGYLHKIMTFFTPGYPLPATSFLVPVLVGALGVIPAFFIGRRLAGNTAGFAAAVIISLHPLLLSRSMGSDNDAWNVTIPLFIMWAALEAFEARQTWRKAALAAAAGLLAAVHATFWDGWWFIYLVVLFAFAGVLALRALQAGIASRSWRIWSDGPVQGSAAALAAFYVSALVFLMLFGERTLLGYLTQPLAALSSGAGLDSAVAGSYWPNVLTTVAELNKASIADAIAQMGGRLLFLAGLVGLLLLALPRRVSEWRWQHYTALGAGAAVFFALVVMTPGKLAALALLGLPVGIVLLANLWRGDDIGAGPALLLLIWMVAAVYATYSGVRFIMLLIPAFGVAFAVLLGRIQEWAGGYLAKEMSWHSYVAHGAVFLVLMLALVAPVKAGHATAHAFVPSIDDGWWEALTKINEETSPDAIINSWWDFGHWFKYVADRRASADGTTQGTHAPYWIGRALVTSDERESVGILRMLDCGSDAYPTREGELGAYGRTLAQTNDSLKAERIVSALVTLDEDEAREYLAQQGISGDAQDGIIARTHCEPPENYFITSGDMVGKAGVWAHFGLWDFEKAYVVETSRSLSQDEAIAAMMDRLGYTQDEARERYFEVLSLATEGDVNAYISPWPSYITGDWRACTQQPNSTVLTCPLLIGIGQQGTTISAIDAFTYDNATGNASLVFATYADGVRMEGSSGMPGTIVLAGPDGIERIDIPDARAPGIAVVIDTVQRRALVTDPTLADSMFTRLFYLDGRYERMYEKFDDRPTFSSSRIITWKVDWDGTQDTAAAQQ